MHDGKNEIVNLKAGQDLSGAQYKIVGVAGTIAATTNAAFGVVYNKPESGEDASVAYKGHMKAYAGAAIAAGAGVAVTTSGFLITVASGDIYAGKALTTAASGDIFNFIGDFTTGLATA